MMDLVADLTDRLSPDELVGLVEDLRRSAQYPHLVEQDRKYAASLSAADLYEFVDLGEAECADGCYVEPDGECPHGHRSPLIVLGLI